MALHERSEQADKIEIGSNRTFGLVFVVVFAVIGGIQLWHQHAWGIYFLGASIVTLAIALLRPVLLHRPNLLWQRFGLLLHKIVNPVVMAALFFGSVLPVGIVLRLMGKRPLALQFDNAANSYWIARNPPGPDAASYKRQY